MLFHRRELLAGAAFFLLSRRRAAPRSSSITCPGRRTRAIRRCPRKPGPWLFFTGAEGRAVEAIADRIIPPDPQTPGGKDAGCAVFIDRQLAGPYGRQDGLYISPPFQQRHEAAGSAVRRRAGADRIASGFAALDRAIAAAKYAGKAFADSGDSDKDDVLKGLESGDVEARRRRRQGVLRAGSSRTCRWGSSPTRSMAAIATWWRGK